MTPTRSRLASAEVSQFYTDGFVGPLPRFADIELIDACARRCIEVERDRPVHPLFGRFSVRDLHLVDDDLLRLVSHPGFVEPMLGILGDELLLWRTTAFVKPPHTGELAWHQDDGFYRGLEYGNDIPSLAPDVPEGVETELDVGRDQKWDLIAWIALDDVDLDMGPLTMARGMHDALLPVAQVPLPEAAFFDPSFSTIESAKELIRKALDNTLVIDIDTSSAFEHVDPSGLTFEEARAVVLDFLGRLTGEITLPFEVEPERVVPLPMKKGEFVFFNGRVPHCSGPNTTDRSRVGLSCRITRSSTLVYPQRLAGGRMDGSNLDITGHRCVRLSGAGGHPDNACIDRPSTRSAR